MNFQRVSYDFQSKTYKNVRSDSPEVSYYKDWFSGNSVDLWRHMRMFQVLDPFLESNPGASWLTVGDGRYGTAAIYINNRGGSALPTDLDDSLLEIAQRSGMIDHYKKENAESLSFDDDSFDYSFCKEAFHHFPRPFIGLYEMLRCTRKAVMFTEPKEWWPAPIPRQLLVITKRRIKSLLGIKNAHPDTGCYESVGNYVYCISKREFEKAALGLNLPCVAYKEFHDIYIEGVEKEQIGTKTPLYNKIKRQILLNRILTNLGLSGMNRVSYILFKVAPHTTLRNQLTKKGFKFVDLPKNPFV